MSGRPSPGVRAAYKCVGRACPFLGTRREDSSEATCSHVDIYHRWWRLVESKKVGQVARVVVMVVVGVGRGVGVGVSVGGDGGGSGHVV